MFGKSDKKKDEPKDAKPAEPPVEKKAETPAAKAPDKSNGTSLRTNDAKSVRTLLDKLQMWQARYVDNDEEHERRRTEIRSKIADVRSKIETRIAIYQADYQIPAGSTFDVRTMSFLPPRED